MTTKNKASQFRVMLCTSLGITLLLPIMPAHADIIDVIPGPVYHDCGPRPCVRRHQTRIRHYVRPRVYGTEVVVRRAPHAVRVVRRHDSCAYQSIVTFVGGPTSYCGTYGYYDESYSYDPDMATGDDDQFFHPNMNIDE